MAGPITVKKNIFFVADGWYFNSITASPVLLPNQSTNATFKKGEYLYFNYRTDHAGRYAVTLDHLNGDANLFGSSGKHPTPSDSDWRSIKSGTATETISFQTTSSQDDLFFMIQGVGEGNYRITFGKDNDADGIADTIDYDDDNDGISDNYEILCGTDPLNASSKPADLDHDGIPDRYDSDKDGDGIDNATEISVGLNPSDPSDGQADSDGDGFSNAIEVSIGTSYRSASDKPGWAPVTMDNIVTFVPYKP
jgi:hypothetical protein